MKIGQPSDKPVVSTPAAAAGSPVAPKAGSGAAVAAGKKAGPAGVAVTVSTRAHALERAHQDEAADVNMEKVEAVRSAIEQGTYVVNPEAIADKLLSNAKEMLNRTRH